MERHSGFRQYPPFDVPSDGCLEEYSGAHYSAKAACTIHTVMRWSNCCVSLIRWDVSLCGGPIVEQATHFVDLMRFFAGEIIEDAVKAVAVGPQQKLSDMPEPPLAEAEVT